MLYLLMLLSSLYYLKVLIRIGGLGALVSLLNMLLSFVQVLFRKQSKEKFLYLLYFSFSLSLSFSSLCNVCLYLDATSIFLVHINQLNPGNYELIFYLLEHMMYMHKMFFMLLLIPLQYFIFSLSYYFSCKACLILIFIMPSSLALL